MLYKILNTDNTVSSIFLRFSLAITILPHGYLKITNFTNIMEALQSHYHLPYLISLIVIVFEFFGSILLFLGLFTRINAMLIGVIMIGAAFYHLEHGFFINWFGTQDGEGYQFHLLAIGVSIALIISGGGKWSIDSILLKKKNQ